jgi:iron complex transport system permease protein
MKSEWLFAFGWPLGAMLAAVAITPWFGAEIVSPASLREPGEFDIFLRFRVARTLLGLLAGASLSVAGCLFQALLRNPLASPYTLGVSTGAALGAVLCIVFNIAWVWTGAVTGAMLALALIASVFLGRRGISATGLILAGVSVNSVCSALIILLQSAAGFAKSFTVTTWLIGALDAFTPQSLAIYAAACLPLAAWVILKSPDWDLLSMGEAWAAGRGVPVRSLLWQACVAGSLLTAATVALTGPIGFVGLMVPHIVRRFAGASHRRLMPACFFTGAAFLITCDAAARTLLRPAEIPVGVLTALLGGPGLIWILRTGRSDA